MTWIRDHRRAFIAVLAVLFVSAALLVPFPLDAAAAQTRDITVNARVFAYDPPTLQFRRGDAVTIRLESMDAAHGLSIDGYDVNLQAEPGKSAQVTFVADREGKFKFRCSVTCGPLHPFMIGEMIVAPDFPFVRAMVATLIASLGALAFFWRGV